MQQIGHGAHFGFGGGTSVGIVRHDETPQCAMTDQEAGVDSDGVVETLEKLGKALPTPGQAGLERGQRHALDLGHHAPGVTDIAIKQGGE